MTPISANSEVTQLRLLAPNTPDAGVGNGSNSVPAGSTSPPEELILDADAHPAENAAALGQALARFDDLFAGRDELIGVSGDHRQVFHVRDGQGLARLLLDRVRIVIVKIKGKKAWLPPTQFLNMILGTEKFLGHFRPVDLVTGVPLYLPGFTLTLPGYNDGGPGHRIVYTGPTAKISDGLTATTNFLDEMAFASNADRTNAVALALTVLLRNHWPGDKPAGIVTASKSHAGKDTIVAFAAGRTPKISIDYDNADWALRNGLVAALKDGPGAGLVNLENVRLGQGEKVVASATLERLLTDAEPALHSSKVRNSFKVKNNIVIAITTNLGAVGEDLMNRGLPIHLTPVGNVADRKSPIGNPKLEYLPTHCLDIETELLGMVERWKAAGSPLDSNVRHPFTAWARTVGGILKVNGFADFLANYGERRTADDPVRAALGLLGAVRPDEWLSPAEWAKLVVQIGLEKRLIPEADRGNDEGRRRGIGVILSVHREETFATETDTEKLTLQLEKGRKRSHSEGKTHYRFVVISREPLPTEDM
jgi:hypothetical protein